MVTAYDVEAAKLIKAMAEKMKTEGLVKPPAWVMYVKSGPHKERAPEEPDFWFKRSASLLRKVYMIGPIGVSKFKKEYSSRKHRGSTKERSGRPGGSIIRKALQQLETAGLIEKKGTGRIISKKGRAFVDNIAKSLK
jgi:small subunit ribosomal protein S19e